MEDLHTNTENRTQIIKEHSDTAADTTTLSQASIMSLKRHVKLRIAVELPVETISL